MKRKHRTKKPTAKIKRIGEVAYNVLRTSAVGHDNAIAKARLVLMVQAIMVDAGLGPVHERALREGIAYVTTARGVPIASATRPPWGYYVMQPDERTDLRRAMLTRVAALVRRMRAADKALAQRIWSMLQREAGDDFQGELFV